MCRLSRTAPIAEIQATLHRWLECPSAHLRPGHGKTRRPARASQYQRHPQRPVSALRSGFNLLVLYTRHEGGGSHPKTGCELARAAVWLWEDPAALPSLSAVGKMRRPSNSNTGSTRAWRVTCLMADMPGPKNNRIQRREMVFLYCVKLRGWQCHLRRGQASRAKPCEPRR